MLSSVEAVRISSPSRTSTYLVVTVSFARFEGTPTPSDVSYTFRCMLTESGRVLFWGILRRVSSVPLVQASSIVSNTKRLDNFSVRMVSFSFGKYIMCGKDETKKRLFLLALAF